MKQLADRHVPYDPDLSVELYLAGHGQPVAGSAADIATEGEGGDSALLTVTTAVNPRTIFVAVLLGAAGVIVGLSIIAGVVWGAWWVVCITVPLVLALLYVEWQDECRVFDDECAHSSGIEEDR